MKSIKRESKTFLFQHDLSGYNYPYVMYVVRQSSGPDDRRSMYVPEPQCGSTF